MKRYLFIFVAFCLLLLSGCSSSHSTDTVTTTKETVDLSNETTSETQTEAETETGTEPISVTQEAAEPIEYEVRIGDSFRTLKEGLGDNISYEFYNAVIWKNSMGYHLACAGEDGETIYAVVSFSDDLKLLEADGIEPIEPLSQMEEWVGKNEEDFIVLYGPRHFQPNSENNRLSFISKDGNIYWMEVENGKIVSMHSFTIDGHLSSVYDGTTPKETEMEVHIGDSMNEVIETLEDSIVVKSNPYVIWKIPKGYRIACTGKDWNTIYAIVSFSDDFELLDAEGLEPIEPLSQMEEWLGKTEEEFIALYGPYHCQLGSGIYMPAYISKNGNVYWMTVEGGTIDSMHSFSIDGHSSSKYSITQ